MVQAQINHSDIIIVGAGPAGLSFASLVAPSGLKITLIEKSSEAVLNDPPYDGREIALTHLSMEIMRSIGLLQHVESEDLYKLRQAKVINGDSDYSLLFPQPKQARGKATDTLGYLISNHNIRRAAYKVASSFDNIEIVSGAHVQEVFNQGERPEVKLADGRIFSSRLLVAADSRFSQTRRQLGISADMHDFGRTVMVFRIQHTQSNHETATECFFFGRTLALLPLGEYMSNCVITIDSNKAHTILDLDEVALAAEIKKMLRDSLGDVEVISKIHTYPLVGVHANTFCAKHSALIGDTAVGMHPVTAHGFNLGLESAQILGQLITQAVSQGKDIASEELLQRYSAKHMLRTRVMYHGTNFVVKLFTNESVPAKALRSLIVRMSNNLPPVKFLVSRQLTG